MNDDLRTVMAIFVVIFTVWLFTGNGCTCGGPTAPVNQILRKVTR